MTKRCDVRGATELYVELDRVRRFVRDSGSSSGLDRTWHDIYPGGCTTTRLHSRSSSLTVNGEVDRQGSRIVGYVSRDSLAQSLDDRTDGRLRLDPH